MGCSNCLKRFVARMSPCLRLAPTVPAGSRVARKYDPLLLRGNVRLAPIMCVPDVRHYQICSLDSVQRVQFKSLIWDVRETNQCDSLITLPVENASILSIYSTFTLRRSRIVIVSRPGGGGLALYILIRRASFDTTRRCRRSKHHPHCCPTALQTHCVGNYQLL